MPSFSTRPGGNTREANARLKILPNSSSRPPMPMSSNLKFGARIAFGAAFFALDLILIFDTGSFMNVTSVFAITMPEST
jgi:hypothetical protein